MGETTNPSHQLTKGGKVWVRSGADEWRLATLKATGDRYTVAYDDDATEADVAPSELLPASLEGAGLEDLTHLPYLNEPSLLQCLQARFEANNIYTTAGSVLIAMNPCKPVNVYTAEWAARYAGSSDGGPQPPHIYQVAVEAFKAMVREGRSQSLVVSGESGAGKTETTKKALQLLASLAGGSGIEERVLETNPILEAFGNAKTLRNDNSSRFGKLLEVHFNSAQRIAGASIKTYLLEKSRVVSQLPGERSYHVFYQLVAGAGDDERAAYHLPASAADFKYLSKSGCLAIEGVNDDKNYDELREAMANVGISASAQAEVFAVVAAVLWLGNIEFVPKDDESVAVKPGPALGHAADLLQVEVAALEAALVNRKMVIGREVTVMNNRLPQAEEARDSLAKALYAGLFNWLVDQVNIKLAAAKKEAGQSIGVLDIFGFEHFESNGFEQLCINTTNERLQQTFNRHVFELQMLEYREEGVLDADISYQDNSSTVALIGKHRAKTTSIFSLLEDTCSMPKGGDKEFYEGMRQQLVKHESGAVKFPPKLVGQFVLQHYAGAVTYNTDSFVDRNKDAISNDLIELAQSSGMPLVQAVAKQLAPPAAAAAAGGGRGSKQPATVSSRFNRQLEELMVGLEGTGLHFVRCIKPNSLLKPNLFQQQMVMSQLRCCGVLEVVRLAQAGYPSRCLMEEFGRRYTVQLPGYEPQQDGEGWQQVCERLLEMYGIEQGNYVFGKNKVFFRAGALGRVEDLWTAKHRLIDQVKSCITSWRWRTWLRKQRRAALAIQTAWRAVAAHKKLEAVRYEAAVVRMQRLFRRQLHRKRQWARLQEAVRQVVERVRATRSTFSKAAEAVAEAQATAAAEAKRRSKRYKPSPIPPKITRKPQKTTQKLGFFPRAIEDMRLNGSIKLPASLSGLSITYSGLGTSREEMERAIAFYREHQGAPAQVAALREQLAAAQQQGGGEELEVLRAQLEQQRRQNDELRQQLFDAQAALAAEKELHEEELTTLQSTQEEVVNAMVESQTKEIAQTLANLRVTVEQQYVQTLQQYVHERDAATDAAAAAKRQLAALQDYTQQLVDTYGMSASFPPPPADSGVVDRRRRDETSGGGGGLDDCPQLSFVSMLPTSEGGSKRQLGRTRAIFESRNVVFAPEGDTALQRGDEASFTSVRSSSGNGIAYDLVDRTPSSSSLASEAGAAPPPRPPPAWKGGDKVATFRTHIKDLFSSEKKWFRRRNEK